MASETTNRNDHSTHTRRIPTTETKPAFKTTELIAYVVVALGVLIASAMVDQNEDGQGFGADKAWLYVTILTVGYMVSRGLAKAGSYERDHDPRT
jgi:hypothetical protein